MIISFVVSRASHSQSRDVFFSLGMYLDVYYEFVI